MGTLVVCSERSHHPLCCLFLVHYSECTFDPRVSRDAYCVAGKSHALEGQISEERFLLDGSYEVQDPPQDARFWFSALPPKEENDQSPIV